MLQKSSVLGDLDKNFKIIEKSFKKCVSNNCDFFLTTELFLTGYPPQDLILRNDFLNEVQLYKKKIKALTKNKSSILLLNIPEKTNNKIFNTLFLFKNGSIIYRNQGYSPGDEHDILKNITDHLDKNGLSYEPYLQEDIKKIKNSKVDIDF